MKSLALNRLANKAEPESDLDLEVELDPLHKVLVHNDDIPTPLQNSGFLRVVSLVWLILLLSFYWLLRVDKK